MKRVIQTDITTIVVIFNSSHCIEPLSVGLIADSDVIFVDNDSEDDSVSKKIVADVQGSKLKAMLNNLKR